MGRFQQHTTGREVVETLSQQVDGKTIVITGASDGSIGGETVLALAAAKPAKIFIIGRNVNKIQPVMDKFKAENSTTSLKFVAGNLDDLDSMRDAASKIASETDKIDVIFNNAGVMDTMPYQTTKQGFEWQFGINHLAHFVLTAKLWPLIKAAGPGAKVINTSSTGYQLGGIPFDDLTWSNGEKYHPWLAYSSSKTANSLFSVEIAKKYGSEGIYSFALQPGMPPTTLASHIPADGIQSFNEAIRINKTKFGGEQPDMSGDQKTVETASSTLLAAAFDKTLESHNGAFLRNCEPYDVFDYAQSPADAQKLWNISEKMTGVKFAA